MVRDVSCQHAHFGDEPRRLGSSIGSRLSLTALQGPLADVLAMYPVAASLEPVINFMPVA